MDKSKALHAAIDDEDFDVFMDLLHLPDVDLNYANRTGRTPLTACIRKRNHGMVKNLIEASCDVNLAESCIKFMKLRPLHVTLNQRKVDIQILQMLLQTGADINVQDYYKRTPLHVAVYCGNLEATSLLLYFGADASITDFFSYTPFMLTIFTKAGLLNYRDIFTENWNEEKVLCIQKMLLNYYDIPADLSGDILHMGTAKELPIVFDLIESGADVNCLDSYGRCLLNQTVNHKKAELFKFIWAKINHRLLVNIKERNRPFLLNYLETEKLSNSEFLECLYLMLDSPFGHNLTKDALNYRIGSSENTFVRTLLKTFAKREILPKARLAVIYTCLSFGIDLKIGDLRAAHEYYGFNEECKALLYAGDLTCNDCVEQIRYYKKLNRRFYLKGFSSFSLDNRRQAKDIDTFVATWSYGREKLLRALEDVPKFPSLLELSRNEALKFIERNFGLTKLYQFYDAVGCLKLPQSMKDVLLLEKPIYSCTEGTLGTDGDCDSDNSFDRDGYCDREKCFDFGYFFSEDPL